MPTQSGPRAGAGTQTGGRGWGRPLPVEAETAEMPLEAKQRQGQLADGELEGVREGPPGALGGSGPANACTSPSGLRSCEKTHLSCPPRRPRALFRYRSPANAHRGGGPAPRTALPAAPAPELSRAPSPAAPLPQRPASRRPLHAQGLVTARGWRPPPSLGPPGP